MAAITITIINGNSDPTFVGTKTLTLADLAVISPTGITTPKTPYVEWVADSTAQLDGSIQIPAWKKLQYFVIPAASKVSFETETPDEAIYYAGLINKFDNITVTVSTNPITPYSIDGFAYTSATVAVGSESAAPSAAPTGAGLTLVADSATYSSSDESVATVATTGKVTGVKAGKTTITYTAKFTITGTSSVVTMSDSVPFTVTAS